jgi:transposase-like protein
MPVVRRFPKIDSPSQYSRFWRVSSRPRTGVDYPGSYAELRAWFPDDAACLDFLDWLRWPDHFRCPLCRGTQAWRLADGRWSCGRCGRKVSATAGTVFHGTRTPLTVWFAAAWLMVSQKQGISALGLKRVLGIGSEQTAWAMLHRYRAGNGASRPRAAARCRGSR